MSANNRLLNEIQTLLAGGGLALNKNWSSPGSATSGINFYDLELGAKMLVPVITPMRNRIPRTSGKGGIQANWRAVTGINVNNLSAGVGFGIRGGKVTNATTDYTAVYKAIGLEDAVDWEADLAAMGFDDVKAIAVQTLLWSLMIREEKMILGGNSSNGLGTTPTPSVATATTGGALPATTAYSVICVALTRDGYENTVVGAAGVPGQASRSNADGTTSTYGGGSAQPSTNAPITTGAGSTNSVTATVAAVTGAVAYAWFFGVAGSEKIVALTTINSVLITAVAAGGNQAATAIPGGTATDFSTNSLEFDGLFTFSAKSGLNALWASQATGTAGTGTPLTSNGEGGIVEIDNDLQHFWDNWRLSPTDIWVNSQEQGNISNKVLSAPSSALRFTVDAKQGFMAGGVIVREYFNRYTMNGAQAIPVRLHPNIPPGTILYTTDVLPYPTSNVRNVMQIRARRDYHQIDWPITSRSYPYGVYSDQVLQHYFPPSLGVRTNIANG